MSMVARQKFKIGDVVVPTKKAIDGNIWQKPPKKGKVVGFPRSPLGVMILVEGRKTKASYHMDFWRLKHD